MCVCVWAGVRIGGVSRSHFHFFGFQIRYIYIPTTTT
jgi:hypothetical protein